MGVAGHHCPPALVEGGKIERRVKKKQNRSKAELLVNNGRFNLVLLKILHKKFSTGDVSSAKELFGKCQSQTWSL